MVAYQAAEDDRHSRVPLGSFVTGIILWCMVVHGGAWWCMRCMVVNAVLDTKLPTAERQSDALEVRRAQVAAYGSTLRECDILVYLGHGRTARTIFEKLVVLGNAVKSTSSPSIRCYRYIRAME